MTSQELRRKLLYAGYDDLVDYLRNSPLNRYIYKQLLVLLPENDIDVPILDIFNEVYYVCVRVRFDNNPGVDVGKRYITDVEVKLNNCLPASRLVFSIVWILFKLKKKLNFHEECFVEQLTPYINNSDFLADTERILEKLKGLGVNAPDEFPAMTSWINDLPLHYLEDDKPTVGFTSIFRSFIADDDIDLNLTSDVKIWWEVTDHFSHATIESYIKLFDQPTDQLQLVEGLRWACAHGPKEHRSSHEAFLLKMRYKVGVIGEPNEEGESEKEWDIEKPVETAVERVERLQREIKLLEVQIENQKKQYEEKMGEIESKYQQEIEELKVKLQEAAAKFVESDECEQSFTISEIVEYSKERIDELSIGKGVSNMLIRLLLDRHVYDEENFQLIDGIEKAIKAKNAPQTLVELPHVGQVNINPQKVENKFNDERE